MILSIPSPMTRRYMLLICCVVLLLIFAHRLVFQHDFTANSRHTLLPQSIATLDLLPGNVDIEIFINPLDAQLPIIHTLLNKYRAHKDNIEITTTDPARNPARMRELDIAPGGEVFIRYKHRTQRLTGLSEAAITMALQRLAHDNPPVAHFTTGHGERSITSNNAADMSSLINQLRDSGFTIENFNLSTDGAPNPAQGIVVVASPLSKFLPIEVALLLDYIGQGGNLVWLTEPESDDGLKAIELELGVQRHAGVVVDLAAQSLDVEQPDFAVANIYSPHQATNDFSAVTLFPQAAALRLQANREWRASALVQAGEQSWTETGSLNGKVSFGDDSREIAGPFPLVIALERKKAGKLQKVIVSGDGDFLADAWIANGGNRELATRIFHWAVAEHNIAAVSRPAVLDNRLDMPPLATVTLVAVALLLLPMALFASAGQVWYSRRHG